MAKFCSNCGKELPDNARACPSCGQMVEAKQEQPAQSPIIVNVENKNSNVNTAPVAAAGVTRNKWVALLLCFFLGFLGAHKFYEGKTGMGILYLFTLGLFGIGEFVDLIILLFKPTEYVP